MKIIRSCDPAPTDTEQRRKERLARAIKHGEQNKRLIDWLTFFKRNTERGLGDTVLRIRRKVSTKSEIYNLLTRLMYSCNCHDSDAVKELNRRYPYS